MQFDSSEHNWKVFSEMTQKAGNKLEVSTIKCDLVHNYIETEQTTESPCPSGWSEFEGNCYKYFDDRMKWEDARDFCLSEQVFYYLTNKSEMLLTRPIWFPFTLIKKIISWLSSPLDVSPGWGERDPAPAAKTFFGLTGPRWTTRFGRLV